MKKFLRYLYSSGIRFFYRLIYLYVSHVPSIDLYQPVYMGKVTNRVQRKSDDRWNSISPHLDTGKGSVLDIGCNIGYFSFKATEQGMMVFGVEMNPFNITVCNAIKEANQIENCVFIKVIAGIDFLEKMPSFDTIFHFSVFHHWVKNYGEQESKEMMKVLASKCNKTLIFETGQSNEVAKSWSKKLKFMGHDHDKWITRFLVDIGFDRVQLVGDFPTGLTEVNRNLYVATK
jgi:SAM-dependent methyltransferase